jgi:DNA (cytosine-5)-methyltransferase 1
VHDRVFRVLRSRADFLTARQIADLAVLSPGGELSQDAVLGRLRHLGQDFELEVADSGDGPAYRLGGFKAFLGRPEPVRHQRFAARRATIS